MNLRLLRLLLVASVMYSVFGVCRKCQWEARLTIGYHTWILHLDAPLWEPPSDPSYASFKKTFHDLPPERSSGIAIITQPQFDRMTFRLLLHLWALSSLIGLAYLTFRGNARDFALQCCLWIAVGMTCASICCVGLWMILGGWGPPFPEFFGICGLVSGLVIAETEKRGK